MKKALKIGGGIIGAVLLLLLGYVIYVFAAYDRIEDNQELSVQAGSDAKSSVPTGTPLNITSWNIGFGAYTDDYSFFMDGGEYSRGFSEDIVGETVEKMASDLAEMDSDFISCRKWTWTLPGLITSTSTISSPGLSLR